MCQSGYDCCGVNVMKNTVLAIVFGVLISSVFAETTDLSSISGLAGALKDAVCGLLGPVAMLLVVVAAVIYAVGQVGTSEMRGKAHSWATWALVGAVMAFVIKVVGSMIISQAFGVELNC